MVILYCAVVRVAESAFPVDIDVGLSVGHLKEAIKQKKKYQFPSDQLQLFLAKKADEWLSGEDVKNGVESTDGLALLDETRAAIDDVGLSEEDVRIEKEQGSATTKPTPVHVLVVVPSSEVGSKRPANDAVAEISKRLKMVEAYLEAIKTKMTLSAVNDLSVSEDEFRLDSLFEKQRSARPIVDTPGLHAFWEDFGGFPLYYFVRMEEVVFWRVIKKLLFKKGRVVIVGSPGVGKSCFLTLIAFYLACIEKRKVLLIRRLKTSDLANVVVFFDGQGSYARLTNLSPDELSSIRGQAQGAIVLVDGFNQAEVSSHMNGLQPFHFLATWDQFRQDSNSRIVVLPAWRFADLLQFAKLTNWVTETGLRTTKQVDPSTWRKLVKEQYFYSGGSLREFCREREMLEIRVWNDCMAVRDLQAFQLMYSFGAAETVDRVWRHYITDCRTEKHYLDGKWWTLSVDSGYALSQLGGIVATEKQLEAYQYAKCVGDVFHGFAYKVLLHNAVQGERKSIVLKMRKGSQYEKIEIRVPRVVCEGDDEATCFSCLSTLGEDTYWRPSYPFFPFIDAVTTCEAFSSGSEDSETIVAYIHVTIRSEKKFKDERLRRLNEEMDKNQSLKDLKRAFVVVTPDAGVCETFTLHGAPDPNTFLAVVSCFDPEEHKPEAGWGARERT